MIKKIFVLSKEYIDLAKEEVLALTDSRNFNLIHNFLIIDSEDAMANRLSYTHSVLDYLFLTDTDCLEQEIRNFGWNGYYKKNFCVRAYGFRKADEEKILASLIWRQIKEPKVELVNPATRIEFFKMTDQVLCGRFISDTDKSYINRKAHLRPSLHPTSMNPKLARAMINLSGVKSGILLDPFCGSGGILIEAGLMGYDVLGLDIIEKMLDRCRNNLLHYGIKNFMLDLEDARKYHGKTDIIVTDLPYGKSSVAHDLDSLYLEFLVSAKKIADQMVIGFPDFFPGKALIGRSGWSIKNEFSVYLHKSLSKNIFVLKK